MKPLARMILVSSLVLAAAAEWLIIKYRNPIWEFMFYDSHVSVVRTALMVIGGVIVIAAVAFAVSRRISHRKCDLDIVSDRAALRGFAVAMLLLFVFCWTLMCSVHGDAMPFQAGAMSCLVVVGSVVAIRAKRKRWIIVYWLIWMFAGALCPAF
jgi:hypothetical protein